MDAGILDRILPYLDVGDCWLWTRALNSAGYGHVGYQGKVHRVHRALYQVLLDVQLPSRVQLDHLCRVRACANPDHLEPVTNKENWSRGAHSAARVFRGLAATRRCGHILTPENTYTRTNGTTRCRLCALADNRRRARQ